ncbi:Olfactory receptor 7A17 [Sciurus carolinensis]|uniref:Olfactory receptor 7A17 n=1 Tax=Sciurus carolinensis TaxID=30640 RepID=A0AA41NEI6_SCICA|nr:Olfactory receptor 7A17 [Sciurus carolinensis]
MEPGNNTRVSEFLLLRFSEDPELQPFIFELFLSMYLVTVLGNPLIILATISDSHLHTPMYFFLSNLSFVDICFTSTTIPKMLVNIQTQSKAITYIGCITQMCFFLIFGELDNFLLAVMAYDSLMVLRLSFCTNFKIPHFFCELNQVVQLACSHTFLNDVVVYFTVLLLASIALAGVLFSYSKIVSSICAISSAQGRYKAFSTCASHLSVVSLFYCTGLRVYLSSAVTPNSHFTATASVMYTVVTPMLNPFIYSLRNKDIKNSLKSNFGGNL